MAHKNRIVLSEEEHQRLDEFFQIILRSEIEKIRKINKELKSYISKAERNHKRKMKRRGVKSKFLEKYPNLSNH